MERLQRINTPNLQDLNYQYDNVSNVLGIQDNGNQVALSMVYDALYRLTFAGRTDSGLQRENYSLGYVYSSIGNLLSFAENNNNSISSYNYGGLSPKHAPANISQSGPLVSVESLQRLDVNGTTRTFKFVIRNNANTTLTAVNWSFFNGVGTTYANQFTTLAPNESVWVFVASDLGNSSEYKVVARAWNSSLWNQRALAIGQQISNSSANLSQAFVYDANGNLVQDGQFYYEYNAFNQLGKIRLLNSTGAVVSSYVYDPQGNRVYKRDGQKNESTFYVNQNLVRTVNGTGLFDSVFYYDGLTLVGRKDAPGNKTFFYHPDQLGSTTLVTNAVGALTEFTNFKPFGEVLVGGQSRFEYTGKEKDAESGLEYYGARYYNSLSGRFVSPDEYLPDNFNPQELNRYSYTLNNPYKFVDPTGHWISPSDFIDYLYVGYSAKQVSDNPNSGENWLNLGIAVGFAVIPVIPNVIALAKTGEKLNEINKAREAAEAASEAKKAAEVAETAKLGSIPAKTVKDLPLDAQETLQRIESGGPFAFPEKDGSVFINRERLLPTHEEGYYREFTVGPADAVSRSHDFRIVVGKGGEKFYTDTHYHSFFKITD